MLSPTGGASDRSTIQRFVAIVILTLVSYAPVSRAGFIWDDDAYLTANPLMESAGGLWRIWTEPQASPQYYPLVFSSFWLEQRLWGQSALGYHLVNVLLHAFSACLVWRILAGYSVPGAYLTALVFAVHPIHVESVAWISERKNVLSGTCYLAALLCFSRYAGLGGHRASGTGDRRLYWVAWVAFLGALFSKTVTSSLPLVILLICWWQRRSAWRWVVELVPFFAVGAVLGLHTATLEKYHVGASGPEWALSFLQRTLIAGRVFWFYLEKLLWPADLSFVYPRWQIDASQPLAYLYPAATVAVVWLLWMFRGSFGRGPLTSALFYIVTLAPASGFFDVYPMQFSFVADHFQYLASLGPSAILCCLLVRGMSVTAQARRVAVAFGAALLSALAIATWQRAVVFQDEERLWRHALAVNPDAWMAANNLGGLLLRKGRAGEAVPWLERSTASAPRRTDSHNNLGLALMRAGDSERAIVVYRKTLELDPSHQAARYNLAIALAAEGDLARAQFHLEWVVRRNARDSGALRDLGRVLALRGRIREATSALEKAVALAPDDAFAAQQLAAVRRRA
ncbi:MAG TPA: tetratricopeptide repeat protein, partial [Candidatus Krumholzibacteria bacterium]